MDKRKRFDYATFGRVFFWKWREKSQAAFKHIWIRVDAYEERFMPLNMLSCKDYDLKTTEPDSVVKNRSATDVSSFILGLG